MTPEHTLLARIVANNDPRKLLDVLLKHDRWALGAGLNQAEIDVLRELKPVADSLGDVTDVVKPRRSGQAKKSGVIQSHKELDVVYDLKAMNYGTLDWHNEREIKLGMAFWWDETPEGFDFWDGQFHAPTQEGRDKIAAMREQFERENA